jgi:hypothetical protein
MYHTEENFTNATLESWSGSLVYFNVSSIELSSSTT